ncbi:argininosuccinate lyase [Bosea robiniae]|uniref:Argininosuccinate lyase n=2 Tax=Bosea TaxID=85413 RepID=A0ABY0P2B0_9HYPH|nr:argininosuccinate lyase [Bosea robiniae]TQI75301.1 argininosuccinate lyase [Bosea sp. AK1]SDG84141.1 argininosuccinate lyase [Bosea robiniae]
MNKPVTEHQFLLSEARLSSPPAEALIKYHDIPGLAREMRHAREFNQVDLAHTVMLAEQGILPRDVASAILNGLLEMRGMDPATIPMDPLNGSFLLQVEAFLFSRMGEDIGGQMHTGRSRIDQGTTVRRLYERNRLLDVVERLNQFRAALIDKAEKHARTIMPGYTHMQQAQPWVFGHYLLSIATRLCEDFERLIQAFDRVNLNPLGAVGLAGTSWPLDRNRTTELLGFGGVLENSKLGREAFYAADAISALSFVMATINDLATDLHVWSSTEFGFVESDDAYCGTSSIFPQKKNPAGLETVKKAAGGSVTWLASALATFRAAGTGDQAMRDLPLIDEALATTEGMLDLFTGLISTLIVHERRMREGLEGSWCTASNLADVIVRETGLSFRQVHHVVARLVRICLSENIRPAAVTAGLLNRAARETIGGGIAMPEDVLRSALDPEIFVETRVTTGSVAPSEVIRMLAVAKDGLARDEAWLVRKRGHLASAAERLESAVKNVLSA